MRFYNTFCLFILVFLLFSCAEYRSQKNYPDKKYFTSKGFALVYTDELYEKKVIKKKINNNNLEIIHRFLKVNTPVKIINPTNQKFVDLKISKKSEYPSIFNTIISRRIAEILELDLNDPYIEIFEIKKNKKFIAKKGNTFDEERNVAEKAPVSEIQMSDITINKPKIKKKKIKKVNYIVIISDFYYEDSAKLLMNDLLKKTNTDKISVKKINDKKYRLFAGPFENFNSLKTTYISLNNLGFDNLDVHKY